jgi:lipid-binding SYLF domain-containing protein
MKRRNSFLWAVVIMVALGISSWAFAAMSDKEKKAAREEVQKMARETLERLYKAQPSAKQAVEKTAGYAVFSNFGLKILVAGSGKGDGLAFNNSTKAVTYMKMLEVQAGLGIGVKKFRLVWIFEKQQDLDNFIKSG